MSKKSFQSLYATYKRRVERRLQQLVRLQTPESIYAPMRYVLSAGGKRLRAVLVLLSCEAMGTGAERAMPAAVATEVLHNFTLVHDDVMDNADLRRGRLTIHKKWDVNVAILVGDELIAHAYRSLVQTRTPRLTKVLSLFTDAFIQVCDGQGLDKEFESRMQVSLDEYYAMIGKKTGRVIAASTEIGATIGDGSPKEISALRKFGEHLGRAFQIKDDLLDITGDEEKFGKAIGGDIVEGKKTFLLLTALNRTRGNDRDLVRSVVKRDGITHNDVERVRTLYERSGVLDAARREIAACTHQAQRALRPLIPSRAKEMLLWLSEQLLERMS
ncbi:MAG: polyprenyl synthetase family protein [Ignavibacteriae bacterium]|nr:polyprenyl synthetase family protein [Ignavibacteria bacterium]MBI3364398.1 polyprenyl synthetase family protein [Ignavibacteriota bacterium]